MKQSAATHRDTMNDASHAQTTADGIYMMALDDASRSDLLAALRVAADTTLAAVDCPACTAFTCRDERHRPHLAQLTAWQALAGDIARLPDTGTGEPLIRFNPDACRGWLLAGAARTAGIDETFSSDDFTIAAGIEELLSLLNIDRSQRGWVALPHLQGVDMWRTADSDGVDGGGVLTADLAYMGQRVRLGSLHQGCDDFTQDPTTSGVDAAVEALGHVAATINREYVNFRRTITCPPPAPTNTTTAPCSPSSGCGSTTGSAVPAGSGLDSAWHAYTDQAQALGEEFAAILVPQPSA